MQESSIVTILALLPVCFISWIPLRDRQHTVMNIFDNIAPILQVFEQLGTDEPLKFTITCKGGGGGNPNGLIYKHCICKFHTAIAHKNYFWHTERS